MTWATPLLRMRPMRVLFRSETFLPFPRYDVTVYKRPRSFFTLNCAVGKRGDLPPSKVTRTRRSFDHNSADRRRWQVFIFSVTPFLPNEIRVAVNLKKLLPCLWSCGRSLDLPPNSYDACGSSFPPPLYAATPKLLSFETEE